jgi:hypothetical protein
MICNTWDYWVFGHCLFSTVLKNTAFWKPDLFPTSGEGVGDTYSLLGLLGRD